MSLEQPYRWHGLYYDEDTLHYKVGARYYDPELGRFTQPDPVPHSMADPST